MSGTGFRLRTEPIGGSPLAQLAQRGAAGASAAWFAPRPEGAAGWNARCRAIATEFAGSAWLEALAPALAAGGAAAERLARVAGGHGVVVTTGQQPGLFGGPIYTWSKAIAARAMADALEARCGLPVAPVFWAATDDADFEEAAVTTIAVRGGARDLVLRGAPPAGTPMALAPLGDVRAELDALAAAAGSASYAEALEAARDAYAGGRTIGDAYLMLLRRLLEPLGIAVLDASHPAVRVAARPFLLRAHAAARDVARGLTQRDLDLRQACQVPQVELVEGLSTVFAIEDGVKRRLRIDEAVRDDSAPLAPNVLLRPVLERTLLPTVAYLAGPGELAYFAQVSAVAEALGAAQPLGVPRWSVTIVESHVDRLLQRLDVTEEQLRDPHAAAGRLARAAMPATVHAALGEMRRTMDEQLSRIAGDPEAGALLPARAVMGAAGALAHRLDRLERRFVAAVKREEETLMTDLATARGYLFPHDARQERTLNFLPILARQGPALLEAMVAEARAHFDRFLEPADAATPQAAALR